MKAPSHLGARVLVVVAYALIAWAGVLFLGWLLINQPMVILILLGIALVLGTAVWVEDKFFARRGR